MVEAVNTPMVAIKRVVSSAVTVALVSVTHAAVSWVVSANQCSLARVTVCEVSPAQVSHYNYHGPYIVKPRFNIAPKVFNTPEHANY